MCRATRGNLSRTTSQEGEGLSSSSTTTSRRLVVLLRARSSERRGCDLTRFHVDCYVEHRHVPKNDVTTTARIRSSVPYRAGYCNSTAPDSRLSHVLNFKLRFPPPVRPSSSLRSRGIGGKGSVFCNNTVIRFAKCPIQSFTAASSVRRRLFLVRDYKKRKRQRISCSYPRTAQHHATCRCPFRVLFFVPLLLLRGVG